MRATTEVTCSDGPFVLRGDFVLRDADGNVIPHHGKAVALCRCGRSARKPFCDATHKRIRAVRRDVS